MTTIEFMHIRTSRHIRRFFNRHPFVLDFIIACEKAGTISSAERSFLIAHLDPLVEECDRIPPEMFERFAHQCADPDFPSEVFNHIEQKTGPWTQRYHHARQHFQQDAIHTADIRPDVVFRYWCVPIRCLMRIDEVAYTLLGVYKSY